jgi:hypothetical protein
MDEQPRLTAAFWCLFGAATVPFLITLAVEEICRWLIRPNGSILGYLILFPSVVAGAVILDRLRLALRLRVALLALYLFAMPLVLVAYLGVFSGFVYKKLF